MYVIDICVINMLWILDSCAIYILHTSAQYQVLVQIGPCFLKWSKIAKTNISIKRPNIACNDEMRYKKDTKAKHVVSYIATRNLVKFLALNNLPVQCQRLLLKLLPLLLPCSAAEKTALWLWTLSLTNSWENWIFISSLKMEKFEPIVFFLQLGTSLASCWPLVLCSRVFIVGRRRIIFIFYQSVLCDTSYVLCSIMHSSSYYLFNLSQSKFPITSGGSSFSSSVIAGFLWSKFFHPSLTPKMLKVPWHPHPPVIFSYQSMKLLQESTLQGCHKRDSFDHSCTLRRVYISIILLQ